MANRFCILMGIAGLSFSCLVQGQSGSAAVVEQLQQPVWIERNDQQVSLYPGQSLHSGDRIITGAKGKALLRMPEGSHVKLGVNANFRVQTIKAENESADGVFEGVWQVIRGAFRFTTSQAKRLSFRRDIKIQIGTATIGVRGTDVWGKATDEKDFIVLLEGKIEIQREGEPTAQMDQALTIYDAPRGGAAKAVVPVNQDNLQKWALETELDQGQGVLSEHGPYTVYLLSSLSSTKSQAALNDIKSQGFAATIQQYPVDDRVWYRIAVTGFISYQDAKAFVSDAEQVLNLKGVWVAKSNAG